MITIIAILGLLVQLYQDYKKYWKKPFRFYLDWNDLLMLSIVAFCDILTIGFTYLIVR
jgi:hypothetical protein